MLSFNLTMFYRLKTLLCVEMLPGSDYSTESIFNVNVNTFIMVDLNSCLLDMYNFTDG